MHFFRCSVLVNNVFIWPSSDIAILACIFILEKLRQIICPGVPKPKLESQHLTWKSCRETLFRKTRRKREPESLTITREIEASCDVSQSCDSISSKRAVACTRCPRYSSFPVIFICANTIQKVFLFFRAPAQPLAVPGSVFRVVHNSARGRQAPNSREEEKQRKLDGVKKKLAVVENRDVKRCSR